MTDTSAPTRGAKRISSALGLIVLVLVSTSLTMLALEMFSRWTRQAPLLAWRDFRQEHAQPINDAIHYDSRLGWRTKPFIKSPGFNTLDYGFRSNGAGQTAIQAGGVLALGASFTAGSEVTDAETWPAQLARMTGWNVTNAGQGGYQADQIILLGEELLPLLHPQVIVVDLVDGTIIGTGYAAYGWAKPYFTIENGELVQHNVPVPEGEVHTGQRFDVKRLLGHLAVVDEFMTALFPNYWFNSPGSIIEPVATDEIGVTCKLLQRLKTSADAAGTHVILYLQYGAPEIVDASRTASAGLLYRTQRWLKRLVKPWLLNTPPGAPEWRDGSTAVGECARNLQIPTVDELPTLQHTYEKNPAELPKYYKVETNGLMGHKTQLGNQAVARRLVPEIERLKVLPEPRSK